MILLDVPQPRASVVTKAIRNFMSRGVRPAVSEDYGFVRLFRTEAARLAVFAGGVPVEMTRAAFGDAGTLYPPSLGPFVSVDLRFPGGERPLAVTVRLTDRRSRVWSFVVRREGDGAYFPTHLSPTPARWPSDPSPLVRRGTSTAPWSGEFADPGGAGVRFYAHDARRQLGVNFGALLPTAQVPKGR